MVSRRNLFREFCLQFQPSNIVQVGGPGLSSLFYKNCRDLILCLSSVRRRRKEPVRQSASVGCVCVTAADFVFTASAPTRRGSSDRSAQTAARRPGRSEAQSRRRGSFWPGQPRSEATLARRAALILLGASRGGAEEAHGSRPGGIAGAASPLCFGRRLAAAGWKVRQCSVRVGEEAEGTFPARADAWTCGRCLGQVGWQWLLLFLKTKHLFWKRLPNQLLF